MGGKKGKGKGEPREENRRGKREGNVDFCASFLFPSLLPRRCSSLVINHPFVFINKKIKFKMSHCTTAILCYGISEITYKKSLIYCSKYDKIQIKKNYIL